MEKYTLIVSARKVGLLVVLNYLARLWGLKKTNAGFGRRYYYLYVSSDYLRFRSLCFILEQLTSKGWAKILLTGNEVSKRRLVFFKKKKISLAFLNLLREELVKLPGKYGPRFGRKTFKRKSLLKRGAKFVPLDNERKIRGLSGLVWAVQTEKNWLNYEFFKKEMLTRHTKISTGLIFSIMLMFFYHELLLQLFLPRVLVYLNVQGWYVKYY